jgi:hypothetical protein
VVESPARQRVFSVDEKGRLSTRTSPTRSAQLGGKPADPALAKE